MLVLARISWAQITVEVSLEQKQYLPNESIPAIVRIINHSGQVLHFGDDAWLTYQVEARDGTTVPKESDVTIPHNFDIKPGDMATTHADLTPCFDISKVGRYSVTASVLVKDWDRQVASNPEDFTVLHGASLWQQEFGVPQDPANHAEPETRKYILEEASLLKRKNLYVRVTDVTESKTFRVNCLGPTLSFNGPQARLDSNNNLHLIYQEASRKYSYIIVNPDGVICLHQTYVYSTSAPFFKVDAAGNPHIAGGERLLAKNDFPYGQADATTNANPSTKAR